MSTALFNPGGPIPTPPDNFEIVRARLRTAVKQLDKSAAGRATLMSLLSWTEDSGVNLDPKNQDAARVLLDAAFGGFQGTVRILIREAIKG